MATQDDVIDAFVNRESSPSRASNFRLVETNGGARAFIVGGRNGERWVIAMREPMLEFTVWRHCQSWMNLDMTRSSVLHQIRRVVRGFRTYEHIMHELQVNNDRTPSAASFPALKEKLQ